MKSTVFLATWSIWVVYNEEVYSTQHEVTTNNTDISLLDNGDVLSIR